MWPYAKHLKKTNAILNSKINNIIKSKSNILGKTPLFKLNLPFPQNNEIHWNDNSDLVNSNFMLWFAHPTPNTPQWYAKHKWTNIQQGPKTR